MAFPKQLLVSYVETLDLAVWNGGALTVNDQDEGAVAGSSVIGFPEGLSQQLKDDILDSTLFAQLAANHAYDHVTDPIGWYQFYTATLLTIGWNLEAFTLVNGDTASLGGDVKELLLSVAKDYLTEAEIGIFKAILAALSPSTGRNEAPRQIFNRSSLGGKKANFQIGIAGQFAGNAGLTMSAFTYGTEKKLVDVLLMQFGNKAVQFSHGKQTMVLNAGVYSHVRQSIKDKLREKAQAQVAAIEL